MDALTLRQDSPEAPQIHAVLQAHHALMRSQSPAESCHVLDPSELAQAGAVLMSALRGDAVVGVGALAPLGDHMGEIKSMHTLANTRGQGVGRAILRSLIEIARERDMQSLWLETGSADVFAPARRLYHAEGFEDCPPFGSYKLDPLSVFMTRRL